LSARKAFADQLQRLRIEVVQSVDECSGKAQVELEARVRQEDLQEAPIASSAGNLGVLPQILAEVKAES